MNQRQAILVADLGYGDAGKGSIVDFLTRQLHAKVVIRYNGGAQAAHNVIDPGGRHHTFAQFGSGTLVPEVRTHLSRFMLVDPLSLLREERHLQALGITDAFERMTIDREALVTTSYHQALNRLREIARGTERHGSCGMGIGETMADALALGPRVLVMGDLHDPVRLKQKLQTLREWKLTQVQAIRARLPDTEAVRRERSVLEDAHFLDFLVETYRQFAHRVAIVGPGCLAELLAEGTVIAEGAQGVLLDEWYGFHPYTTWSTTTFQNADTLLREHPYNGQVVRLGVLRAYATRHGPGPFVTEDTALADVLPEPHNVSNAWQLTMRVGHFDAVAARYALAVTGQVDLLAITHIDQLRDLNEWKISTQYEYRDNMNDLADFFVVQGEALTDIRVSERPNLERQEQLTQRLQQCVPHYQIQRASNSTGETEADVSSYLAEIERGLGVPIGIVSEGPTTHDKRFTPMWAQHVERKKEHQTPGSSPGVCRSSPITLWPMPIAA